MQGQETERKITVKAAAQLLEVATKTIQRYLAKGRLTRIKEGTRTLLLLSEVNALQGHPILGQGRTSKGREKSLGTGQSWDTVTLGRDRYEQLLLELGELRKQNQFFLEFKGMLMAKEEGIRKLEREVEELRTRVRALESKQPDESWMGTPQGVETASDQQETKPKPKKSWWQA